MLRLRLRPLPHAPHVLDVARTPRPAQSHIHLSTQYTWEETEETEETEEGEDRRRQKKTDTRQKKTEEDRHKAEEDRHRAGLNQRQR